MHAGRITLQGQHRMVGQNGKLAIGDELINIMSQIEGREVQVYWLDGNDGQVLKALVYTPHGQMVCELLHDFEHSRATLERTPQDDVYQNLTAAYAATVRGYAQRTAKAVDRVTLIETETKKRGLFTMPGLELYEEAETTAEVLPALPNDDDFEYVPVNTGLKGRF